MHDKICSANIFVTQAQVRSDQDIWILAICYMMSNVIRSVSFSRGLYLDGKDNFKQNMAIYNSKKQEKEKLELSQSCL